MKIPRNLPPVTRYSNDTNIILHAQLPFPVHERHKGLLATYLGCGPLQIVPIN